MTPGRGCPLHYRYFPSDLAHAPELAADTLYVIGGLYGNLPALDQIAVLAAYEPRPPLLVFNGDFNWFNIDRAGFEALNRRVLDHAALRGNVETELAGDDTAAGCGCGYPDFVADAEVERSNRILEQLRATARAFPDLRSQLGALPVHLVAAVGELRIAIVHGDCESLAGWGLSQQVIQHAEARARAAGWFAQARVRVIASSHSCLPVATDFETSAGLCAVFNNGAAGMPNFRGTGYGVLTRIATRPAAHVETLYATRIADIWIEAIPIHYDQRRWLDAFRANWPPGSPAHASYYHRITQGPAFDMRQAARLTVSGHPEQRPTAGITGRT